MMLPDSDTIVHLIQLSVAPVFLIAGVAGLLNVFTGRLTRIVDKLEKIEAYIYNKQKKNKDYKASSRISSRRNVLIIRLKNVNLAILFATVTGLMVSLVILSAFAATLFSFQSEIVISISFMLAMLFLILSLVMFLREIYYTSNYIKLDKHYIEY
jgi:CBS domain containing-hemolysin-like protein